MKKCVAYCRVSTSQNDQLNSLENQILHYTQLFNGSNIKYGRVGMLCRSNGDIEYRDDGLFIDEGISGTSTKYRKAFLKMLEMVSDGAFDTIYVKNVERWARNVADAETALDKCEIHDVNVIFEDMPDKPSRLVLGIYFNLAKEDSSKKSVSIKWGKEQSFLQGRFNSGAPPYGYDVDSEKKKLKINEAEAEVVKKIYELYVGELMGSRLIARYLNERDIPTKRKLEKGWEAKVIQHILTNTVYIGKLVQRKTKRKTLLEKTRTPIPKEQHIFSELPELRILDDEIFNNAQNQREIRGELFSKGSKHSNKNLFSSLIYCGDCGGAYKRKKRTISTNTYKWVCSNSDEYKNDVKRGCKHRKIMYEEVLIEDVANKIHELQGKDLVGLLEIYKILYYDFDLSEERIAILRKEEAELKAKIDFNFDLAFKKRMPEEEYEERNSLLNTELEKINLELDSIKNYERRINKLYADYHKFTDNLDAFDFNNITNASLKKVFKKIVMNRFTTLSNDKKVLLIVYYYSFLDVSIEDMSKKIKAMGSDVFRAKAEEKGLHDVSLSSYLLSTMATSKMVLMDEETDM